MKFYTFFAFMKLSFVTIILTTYTVTRNGLSVSYDYASYNAANLRARFQENRSELKPV